jgi:hypothetical protein
MIGSWAQAWQQAPAWHICKIDYAYLSIFSDPLAHVFLSTIVVEIPGVFI